MYDREYGDTVLSFEPSGALKDATLVMRDRETDSWWSIISGDAIGGTMEGQKLVEIPAGEKVQWGEWRRRHPDTLVLSVDGVQHDPVNPYEHYFESDATFRDIDVKDTRLSGKESVFAFRWKGAAYAVPSSSIEGGAAFEVDGTCVFLYRSEGANVFESTQAYIGAAAEGGGDRLRFYEEDGSWRDAATGGTFESGGGFQSTGNGAAGRLAGFDTFWYSWSNVNQNVVILGNN